MDEHKKDNVVFIFDDPAAKKPGAEITIACPDCKGKTGIVLYATQQPFYEDADDPADVATYLLIRCTGKRCDLVGLVEQKDRDEFERIFPEPHSS